MTKDRAHTNEPFPEHVADNTVNPYTQDISAAEETPHNVPAVVEHTPAPGDDTPSRKTRRNRKGGATGSNKTIAGGTWVALIVGALLLIALLVFILQNQAAVQLNIITWTFEIPAGIAYLLCAIAGALIMAIVGGVRMFEYRHKIKKMQKVIS